MYKKCSLFYPQKLGNYAHVQNSVYQATYLPEGCGLGMRQWHAAFILVKVAGMHEGQSCRPEYYLVCILVAGTVAVLSE